MQPKLKLINKLK